MQYKAAKFLSSPIVSDYGLIDSSERLMAGLYIMSKFDKVGDFTIPEARKRLGMSESSFDLYWSKLRKRGYVNLKGYRTGSTNKSGLYALNRKGEREARKIISVISELDLIYKLRGLEDKK